MSLSFAFAGLLAGILVWAIIVRRLTVKPWELHLLGPEGAASEPGSRFDTMKTGLWVFLAIVTSLFGLFISAYYMRMGHGHATVDDWSPVVEPAVLWLNTFVLILSSVAMQAARTRLLRGNARATFEAMLVAGLLTLAFIAGQLFAWRQLQAIEFFSPRNPALAFFYLLTAVHALHLAGGMVVWFRTLARMRKRDFELIEARTSVELCAIYWHYLLIVWLVLFALLLST